MHLSVFLHYLYTITIKVIIRKPVTGNQVTVTYNVTSAQPATITLLDNFGHTVRRQQVNLQAGNNSLNFVTGKLKTGIYTLQMRYNGKTESTKLMIGQP
jgi:hypothetical protein